MQAQESFLKAISNFNNSDFKDICQRRSNEYLELKEVYAELRKKEKEIKSVVIIDPYNVDLDHLPSRKEASAIAAQMRKATQIGVDGVYWGRSSLGLSYDQQCILKMLTGMAEGDFQTRCYDTEPNKLASLLSKSFLSDLKLAGYTFSSVYGATRELGNDMEPPDWDYKKRRWLNISWD